MSGDADDKMSADINSEGELIWTMIFGVRAMKLRQNTYNSFARGGA